MLFLLNDQIVDIELPEQRLEKRWRMLGCGEPMSMRAREALDFAAKVVAAHSAENIPVSAELAQDLGALIIAKTGANAALFPVFGAVAGEPRLTILPEQILEALRQRASDSGIRPVMSEIWPVAA
jgi:hypothetical protein